MRLNSCDLVFSSKVFVYFLFFILFSSFVMALSLVFLHPFKNIWHYSNMYAWRAYSITFNGILIYSQYASSSFSSTYCCVINICSSSYTIMALGNRESMAMRLGKVSV